MYTNKSFTKTKKCFTKKCITYQSFKNNLKDAQSDVILSCYYIITFC